MLDLLIVAPSARNIPTEEQTGMYEILSGH
jgi:hypothetical protein